MTAIVQPIPRTPEEIAAWFAALSVEDIRLAFLGAAVVALAALLLVLGTMALLRVTRR